MNLKLKNSARHLIQQLFTPRRILLALLLTAFGLLAPAPARAVGTWTPLTHGAPTIIGTTFLLTDGTVMAQGYNTPNWYRLTPDTNGSYVNGTWTTLASMQATHAYYSSQVLRDGRVYVGGGEYGNGSQQAEFYQPTNNTWTRNDPGSAFPGSPDVNNYGASGLLPNGNVIVATFTAPKTPGPGENTTVIYDVTSNTWSVGPKMIEFTDEGTFVKLPDDSLLTLDINGVTAERYIPALNKWIVDAPRPVVLYNDYGEMGGGYMLPNGKLIFLGGTSHTAIYTPSGTTNAGTWTAGADFPYERGMSDAPSAMMVNGKILCAASPNNLVGGDTQYFEYDYVANAFTQLNSPFGGTNYGAATFIQTMMPLPDGTVLYCSFYGGTSRLYARWFASGGW